MYKDSSEYDVSDRFAAALRSNQHKNFVILAGSIVSRGFPTLCPDVGELRSLLMDAFSEKYDWSEKRWKISAIRLMQHSGIKHLPFEQFMRCISIADHDAATQIVEHAFGEQLHGKFNTNHELIGQISKAANQHGFEQTTVITTNYDCCLEKALNLPDLDLLQFPVQKGEPIRVPIFRNHRVYGERLCCIKIHGSTGAHLRDSLTYTFDHVGRLRWLGEKLTKYIVNLLENSLVLAVGYGFNDYELRPIFETALKSPTTLVFRNDIKDILQDSERKVYADAINRQFFDRHKNIQLHIASLLDEKISCHPHFLNRIAELMGVGTKPVPAKPSISPEVKQGVVSAIQNLHESQALRVLAELSDACSADSGTWSADEFSRVLSTEKKSPWRLVRTFVVQAAHEGKRQSSLQACRQISRHARSASEKFGIATSRCLIWQIIDQEKSKARFRFIKLIGSVIFMFKKIIYPIFYSLEACYWLQRIKLQGLRHRDHEPALDETIWLRYLNVHYLSGVLRIAVTGVQNIPPPLDNLALRVFQLVSGTLAKWYEPRLIQLAQNNGQIKAVAESYRRYSDLLLFSQKIDEANNAIDRSIESYLQIAEVDGVILSHVSQGWIHWTRANESKEEEKGDSELAVQTMLDGFSYTPYSSDPSVVAKIAANIVVALAAQTGTKIERPLQPSPLSENLVADASSLRSTSSRDAEKVQSFCNELLSLLLLPSAEVKDFNQFIKEVQTTADKIRSNHTKKRVITYMPTLCSVTKDGVNNK